MAVGEHPRVRRHVLQELGFATRRIPGGLEGSAVITPEMHVPGTERLRTSILAAWADTLEGLLAVDAVRPRVPVTLELDVHLYDRAPSSGGIIARARTLKAGRSVFVASVIFTTSAGRPVAVSTGSFMVAPDPTLLLPDETSVDMMPSPGRLEVPLAERARVERRAPGVASLPKSDDGLNSSNTVNGGLIALVAEEAALSLSPGATLSTMSVRYLQAVRVGPVVATAEVTDGLGTVELRDAGNGDRLSVVVTTRTFE